MKKISGILLILATLISCGEVKTKSAENQTQEKSKKEDVVESLPSADYSSLLINYTCDMTVDDVAKVLQLPSGNLSIPDYAKPDKCYFDLKGFGENTIGGQSSISWGTSKSSKADIKNEIASYLKNQEELPDTVTMGMGIELAETKDCYLAFQPAHGRVIILNENYDNMFLLSYGRMSAATSRTKDQQDELKIKMTQLANYLLKKHKK